MEFGLEERTRRRPAADPYIVDYRGYQLKCRPQPTPDERFMAYVIVSQRCRALHTEAALTPDLPTFARQADAARAGLEAGRRWVDEHARQ
jgi:hypothetical protein